MYNKIKRWCSRVPPAVCSNWGSGVGTAVAGSMGVVPVPDLDFDQTGYSD